MKTPKLAAAVLVAIVTGCAVQSEPTDDIELRASQAALSRAPSVDLWRLFANATFDAVKGKSAVQLDTRDPIAAPDPKILDDRYLAVFVYRERADGVRELLITLRNDQIGPGGGCIHFDAPAWRGDRLFIGAVLKLAGADRAVVGVVPEGTIVF